MRIRALVLLLVLAACARLHVSEAIPSRPWRETAKLTALEFAVDSADGYVLGTIERAQKDEIYDDFCGLHLGGPCHETHAYRLTIRSASDTAPPRLWVFVPRGDTLALPVGTTAVFIWRMRWIQELAVCAERFRRGAGDYCFADHLPIVPSRDNVVAPADSALVAALFAGKVAR